MNIKNVVNLFLAIILLLPIMNSVIAQDVVLNPVEVTGTISFGGNEFRRYIARAKSGEFNASSESGTFDPAVSESGYSLTVNVEEGTTRQYYIGATFFSGSDRYGAAPKLVDVQDLEPSQATAYDIAQDDFGTVHGEIILPAGAELDNSNVRFYFDEFRSDIELRDAGYKNLTADQLSFDLPVAANTDMYIVAYLFLKSGQQHTFVIDPFTVDPGTVHDVVFEIIPAIETGSVGGTIDLQGPVQITEYWSRIYGPGGNINKYYYPEDGSNQIDWSIDNMPSSDTAQYKQWIFPKFRSQGYIVQMSVDYNAFNPSEQFYILQGQHTNVDVIVNQAFIEGQLNIEGNFPHDEMTFAQIRLLSTRYGNSPAVVDLSSMSYSAMGLDVGEWAVAYARLFLSGPENAYREVIEYYPYTNTHLALTAGQPENQDLNIAMGSVTVKFSITDGQTLSAPRIISPPNTRPCKLYNDQGDLLHMWKTTSYVYDQIDVLEGSVTFHGPDAYCEDLKAEALVNGSWTTFGYIDVEVVSGVDIVIDVGGPSISVDIAPNTVVDTSTIEVTGTATDDVEVSSVTINGISATLFITNNPDDPNEVGFSATIPLNLGSNALVTIATDSSDKQGSDTRNIFYELPVVTNSPPVVGDITVSPDALSVGESVLAEAAFSDPDENDRHTAVWDWGDNSQCDTANDQNCTIAGSSLSATHIYTEPGIYTVNLSLTDEQGETDTSSFQYVIVFDENAGFVTGGGWIESPAGAYMADASLTGSANFGFVASYKKGASTPTGNTEFQFHMGNMNFHTDRLLWMVIGESNAIFAGEGTLNGIRGYGIRVSVVDGRLSADTDVDLLRVVIWDTDSGDVLYDSQPGADILDGGGLPISRGSIVVHSKKK